MAVGMVGATLLAVGRVCARSAPKASKASSTRQLLRDARFQGGFIAWAPEPGKKIVCGSFVPPGARGEPVWGLAQWGTRLSLAGARAERLPSRAIRFANAAKAITIAPRRSRDADLAMAVDTRPEYGERARRQGEPWVHLLLEQSFQDPPALADLKELLFRARARLLRADAFPTPDYSPHLHAAQFQVFLTVQNLNTQSKGYGKLLWFGIPLYDDRSRIPPRFTNPDAAGLFIYTPSGDAYTNESAHDGKWVAVERDVLPLVLDGLRTAWERGFLTESRDLADYRVSAINIGWEVPGIFDVAMQVEGLGLEAVE